MPTLETIRRLRLVATTEGFDEASRQLDQVAEGQQAVVCPSERAARLTLSIIEQSTL